jgi:hypothetical protein
VRSNDILGFLRKLEAGKLSYRLTTIRDDAVMVVVHVPGQIWEVEFFADGTVEVQKFVSDGAMDDQTAIDDLLRDFGEPLPP